MAINPIRAFYLASRGTKNFLLKRPFCVSFEITYSCNAKCKHCHLGGIVKDEEQATPERFGARAEELKPVVAQISGGEPLLRRDLEQIIKLIKRPQRPPYIVLTTNASLLTKEKYASLREAGVDEFSVSLDYPDERHDEFRGVPGLFKRIETLCTSLRTIKDKCITLSCVVQSQNYKDVLALAEKAREWEVKMNFSAYTMLRTAKKEYMISEDEMPEFKEIIRRLIDFKRKYKTVFTSEYVFKQMIKFFENHETPNCRAGERFLVVNPDGTLSPCGLIIKKYQSQREIKEDFLKSNTCNYCFTSIRANSEKPAKYLIKDNLQNI